MKARPVTRDGVVLGYLIECPACGYGHFFDNRWTFNGDMNRPTFTPSMLVNGDSRFVTPTTPRCHSFVIDGVIKFLSDCSHSMAGQEAELKDW